ncbi:hypothetical protein Ocin01_05238 [Orchesella cincta]|uniref:Uncharacterized protein n=1 Tax=Orchesella cincta TaxID=48709 RepID=A0A1D2N8L3_ORCCI|nr:hypothetical protein Ocin01_05238 [Orchesella cincta]
MGRFSNKMSSSSRNRRNWNETEKREVLDRLLETIRSGKWIEKPNASVYYDLMLKKLSFNDCSVSQLKNMVNNMKRKYIAAKDWRGAAGQGVLEEEGEESVLAALRKMCLFFDELEEIYGSSSSVTPPKVHDSSVDMEETTFQDNIDRVLPQEMDNSQNAPDKKGNEEAVMIPRKSADSSKAKKRKMSESGIEMLSSSEKLRFEIEKWELVYQKEKWEHEKAHQDAKVQLERERFEFEKQITERKLTLEEKKQDMEFELAKYKTEKEIELAKLSTSK